MKKIIYSLLASTIICSSVAHASVYTNAGKIERKTEKIQKNKVIEKTHQYRDQQGWMYVEPTNERAISGFYQAGNWLKLDNRNYKIGVGSIEFAFNPSKFDCTQGLSLNLEVGEDTVASIKPNCDDLLNASVTYPVSHYFDLIPEAIKPKIEIPMDPLGLFKVGVKIGVGIEAGVEFEVGGVIGGHGNEAPFKPNGVRRPDYIYASAEPYVSGQLTAASYASFGHGISEAGVKGKLTLLKVQAKGYVEAGIRRVEQNNQLVEQGFLALKISGKLSGGQGKIEAYCKKLWGLLYFKADILKWDPIYQWKKTFYEYESPVWENL